MRALSNIFTRIAERYLPDAFIFVFALTILVFILGMLHGSSFPEVLDLWGKGLFELLPFTMQSTLILVTGFALAQTGPVNRVLKSFARLPKNEVQVIVLTTLVMMVCSWISWGFGLIAGAIVAREMGIVHRGKIHYPLVVASSYAGFVVWHAGYGGSIPQLIATPGHFLEKQIGVIPVTETIFAPFTYVIVIALAIIVPISLVYMRPKQERERVSLPAHITAESEIASAAQAVNHESVQALTPALRWENSRFVTFILGILGLAYIVNFFANGGALNINIVILSFLTAGLLFTANTKEYMNLVMGGSTAAFGIIVQFPFYGALMGIIVGTGIATTIANSFLYISTADTLPFWSFISGGIINFFVPSGGGQWSVQGPIMIEAANQLGANIPRVAMGIAWGDAWTNMIQPFWTLPLLAIAGLGIRDIMGYTAVVLLVSGVVIGAGLLIL